MAITLTIVKKKGNVYERKMIIYHSLDKARKEIAPIAKEMRIAEKLNKVPNVRIEAVSYDTKSEKSLLLETRAIVSTEHETENT